MSKEQTIKSIINTIKEARIEESFNKELANNHLNGKNEFLFFIKPEITLKDDNINFNDILELIFDKLSEFSFDIKNIRIVNAKYLENHKIINQHYGVISQLSSDLRNNITETAKLKFEELYTEKFDDANVLGSIEFIKKYPFFSPTALSVLWQNSPTEKLGGGTYSQKLIIDGETVYLVNGFHPRQLEHFTTPERAIVVMTLVSDTDWTVARNKLIGKTNPEDAEQGSIRRELLDNQDKFGLQSVSSTWNGVHLSAGPVEGLIELIRYNSDFESGNIVKAGDFEFGNKLISEFGEEKTHMILENPNVEHKGKSESVFDLTEELNSNECLDLLKELYQ